MPLPKWSTKLGLPVRFWWYVLVSSITFAMLFGRLFTASLVPIFFVTDHSALVEDAQRMFYGERLYADFFNFTFPGTQYIYYFGFRIFGLRPWVPNAVALVLGILLATLTFAVATRVLPEKWACIAAILSLCFGYGARISPTHHFFSVAAVLAALLLLLDSDLKLRWAAVGSAVAFAVWFSQVRGISVALGVAIMIISGLAGPARSPWPIRLRYLLGYLGTVILVLATFLIAPLYHVGIAHFLSCTFQFPFQHGRALEDNHFFYNFTWEGLEVQPGIWNLRHIFEPLFTFILVPVICAIIFIRLLRSDRGYIWRHRRIVVTAAILLCSYISVLPSPTTIRVAPDASLAFVVLVWYLRQYVSSFRLIVVAMLAISLPLALYRLRPRDIATLNTFGGRIAAAPAEAEYDDLRWRTEHVRPGTYFLSTDYGDYFPIGVRNPMPCGFLTNTPFTPAWQVEETTRRLMEYKVQYIKWDANELDVTHPAADPGDNLNPLRDYIRTRYRPLFTTGGSIYFEYVGDTRERIVAQK